MINMEKNTLLQLHHKKEVEKVTKEIELQLLLSFIKKKRFLLHQLCGDTEILIFNLPIQLFCG